MLIQLQVQNSDCPGQHLAAAKQVPPERDSAKRPFSFHSPLRKPVLEHFWLCRPKPASDLPFNLCALRLKLQDGTFLLFLTFPARKHKERQALLSGRALQNHSGQKGERH